MKDSKCVMRSDRRPWSVTREGAFSLIEVLVVLVIVGLLAMLGLVWVRNVAASGSEAVARRNAQAIVDLSSLAHSAGLHFPVGADLEEAVDRVVDGRLVGGSAAERARFRLTGLDVEDRRRAIDYLRLGDARLHYVP